MRTTCAVCVCVLPFQFVQFVVPSFGDFGQLEPHVGFSRTYTGVRDISCLSSLLGRRALMPGACQSDRGAERTSSHVKALAGLRSVCFMTFIFLSRSLILFFFFFSDQLGREGCRRGRTGRCKDLPSHRCERVVRLLFPRLAEDGTHTRTLWPSKKQSVGCCTRASA